MLRIRKRFHWPTDVFGLGIKVRLQIVSLYCILFWVSSWKHLLCLSNLREFHPTDLPLRFKGVAEEKFHNWIFLSCWIFYRRVCLGMSTSGWQIQNIHIGRHVHQSMVSILYPMRICVQTKAVLWCLLGPKSSKKEGRLWIVVKVWPTVCERGAISRENLDEFNLIYL